VRRNLDAYLAALSHKAGAIRGAGPEAL
jgi:hypothetical protein